MVNILIYNGCTANEGRTMRRRNTQAFTFLAWTSFVCALSGMLIGIYTLDETLSVKGYYLLGTLFLTMSCFVLQKQFVIMKKITRDFRKINR